jgi:hypothetical protein
VVRATASETRKRIAQYYHEEEHYSEIRIDLSPRSYIPEIVLNSPPRPAPVVSAPPVQPVAAEFSHWKTRLPWMILAVMLCAGAAGIWGIGKTQPERTALDRFWGPMTDAAGTIMICIGQRAFVAPNAELSARENSALARAGDTPAAAGLVTLSQLYYMGSENIAVADARTLARLAGVLSVKGKDFRILGGSSTTYGDLRNHPVILIGGLNNDWTLRLMGSLRFRLDRNGEQFWIRDRNQPEKKDRVLDFGMPYMKLATDYALITRVRESSTERTVVVAAGLAGFGTMAAGEFLSDPKYMEDAVKGAPEGWERRNLQFVLATDVIRGNSGPPRVLERYYW